MLRRSRPKGDRQPGMVAPEANFRTDLPRSHVFRQGELVEELTDIQDVII